MQRVSLGLLFKAIETRRKHSVIIPKIPLTLGSSPYFSHTCTPLMSEVHILKYTQAFAINI